MHRASSFFFDLSFPDANFVAAFVVLVIASVSFIGIGDDDLGDAAHLPGEGDAARLHRPGDAARRLRRLLPRVGAARSGCRRSSKISPATYALEGIRAAILDGDGLDTMWGEIWPLLVIGAVSVPLGLWVFHRGEVYAKRHGKLKRSG